MAKQTTRKKTKLADLADRHELYELSVQCPEAEIDFVDGTFLKLRRRRAELLHEDFCATANVCAEWVKRRRTNRAIGIDLDPEVLAWSRDKRLSKLSKKQRERVTLIQADVLTAEAEPADIISAMNFSYWLFKERATLKRYFQHAWDRLKDDGILFMDAYGGHESYRLLKEKRVIENESSLGKFTYTWEQGSFNPINHDLSCYIHFRFSDGSKLDRAFEYHWRLWSLPEIQDLLAECGFKTTVYWQGWDEDGEGDGNFQPATVADADPGWICYLVAEKLPGASS